MNTQYISLLRNRLQRRTQDLLDTPGDFIAFHHAILRYWDFLVYEPTLSGVLNGLSLAYPDLEEQIERIQLNELNIHTKTNLEQAALAFFGMKYCGEAGENRSPENRLGFPFDRHHPINGFRTTFIIPLYNYLTEQLEDGNYIVSSLIQYKSKVEWFGKQELFTLYNSDSQSGEKNLIYHLYEYLFDQGIPFTIEPTTASGRPDLLANQTGPDYIIADAKVYKGGKAHVKQWLNQVYTYTQDYNESIGYVVIYNIADEIPVIESDDLASTLPVIVHNQKTIFFLVVDINADRKSASTRGSLKTVGITKAELIEDL